ncbi:MAG TPA: hypothetical protein VFT40_00045 [Sphingomicrobium sp.]|jgi:hypothetical protein|nr:hypothetical protein [Sphingomicrobium sp.]
MRIPLGAASLVIALVSSVPAIAATGSMVSGQGALSSDPRRNFSVSAKINADGTASGHATLINKAFTGENGKSPYLLQLDIKCGKMVDANTAIFGGTVKRTNDTSLVDTVYFSVQDNGEPGAGSDKVSRAFFFDGDPATTGDPALCLGATLTDLPLETIVSGNLNVH